MIHNMFYELTTMVGTDSAMLGWFGNNGKGVMNFFLFVFSQDDCLGERRLEKCHGFGYKCKAGCDFGARCS